MAESKPPKNRFCGKRKKPVMRLEQTGWEFVEGTDEEWLKELPIGTILYFIED